MYLDEREHLLPMEEHSFPSKRYHVMITFYRDNKDVFPVKVNASGL